MSHVEQPATPPMRVFDPHTLADRVKKVWCALAEETVTGLRAKTVADLPGILKTLTANVDTKRARPHGSRDGG
jgi:hypothetical protein